MNYPSNTQSLTDRVHRSAGPARHRHKNRGGGSTQHGPAELANDEDSSETEGTGMFPKLPRVD